MEKASYPLFLSCHKIKKENKAKTGLINEDSKYENIFSDDKLNIDSLFNKDNNEKNKTNRSSQTFWLDISNTSNIKKSSFKFFKVILLYLNNVRAFVEFLSFCNINKKINSFDQLFVNLINLLMK